MRLHYAYPYLPLAAIITLISWAITYQRGAAALGLIAFLKLFTLGGGLLLLRNWRRKEVYFYRNIGLDENKMLLRTGVVDLAVWLLGLIVLVQLVH